MPETIALNDLDLDPAPAKATRNPDAPTDKQLTFARNLYREIRDLGARYHLDPEDDNGAEAHLAWSETVLETIGALGIEAKAEGKRAFSRYIDDLITRRDDLRTKVRDKERTLRLVKPEAPDVPAGRYAITGEDGVLRFYVVDRPTEGRWAGYVFVSVQASDELHRVRDRAAREAILATIAIDPRDASIRYGKELGQCGVCGRTLTNEESRAAGIGPVCAAGF